MDLQCTIATNADISGLGVRISLYIQTAITIVMIAISPENAKAAWWSMTTTSMGLAIASIAAGAIRSISLLDAIILSHLLVLPLITAAYALSRLTESQRVTSPLLVVVDAIRFCLATAFGIWLWAFAPLFGKQPVCNNLISFAFFGARIRATSVAARVIGLMFWSSLGILFLFRQISSMDTLFLSTKAIVSDLAARAFRMPRKTGLADEVHRSQLRTDFSITFGLQIPPLFEYPFTTWHWSAELVQTRRPDRGFHSPDRIIPREILDSQLGRTIHWILFAIACSFFAFVVIMVEFTLHVENPGIMLDNSFSFGQILPLALIIAPAFSFLDWWMQSRPRDPVRQRQSILLTIDRALNLPHRADDSELNCYCVISISDADDIFVTWIQPSTNEPEWGESFVLPVTELSSVLIQVFDSDGSGSHGLIGHTIFTPLHNPGRDFDSGNPDEFSLLRCNGLFGNQRLYYSLSKDTQQTNVTASPRTLSPQGPVERIVHYMTVYPAPFSLFSLTYRMEALSQTLGPTPVHPAQTNIQGRAVASWFCLSNLIPPFVYGVTYERSPTKLPDAVQEPPVPFRRGPQMNGWSLGPQWVPGPFYPLQTEIRIFGKPFHVSVPFLFYSRSSEGFAISISAWPAYWGLAKTRPLPLRV